MAQHFKDLIVWQKAMEMVTEIYKLTDTFRNKKFIVSLIKFVGRPFQFRAISQRVKRTTATANFVTSCGTLLVRLLNLRLSYF
jgi:hypothetical protein